jgi:hypothetical protein
VIPALVAAYLERALPADQPEPRSVRITQQGRMWREPGEAQRRFTAVQHLAVDRVAFAWRARFPIITPFALNVTDSYADGEGRLDVRMLGRTLEQEEGPEMAVGEAMRYLAELPWVPYAMARNGDLRWQERDARCVEVATTVGGESASVALEFDEAGDIVRASSPARPLHRHEGWTPMAWGGEYSLYRELGGMRMPAVAEVYWDLPEGRHTYWRGEVVSAVALETPFEPGG